MARNISEERLEKIKVVKDGQKFEQDYKKSTLAFNKRKAAEEKAKREQEAKAKEGKYQPFKGLASLLKK